jgi:hypothetical protein
MTHSATSDLVKSVSIENLLSQRNAVLERFSQALDLIGEADALATVANLGRPRLVFESSGGAREYSLNQFSGEYARKNKADVMAAFQRTVDAGAWQHLMSESGMRSFMSAKVREQWDSQIHGDKKDIPPLTRENIIATFENLYATRGEMMENGVIECFRALSWQYRTNQPVKFGKKIIMQYFLRDPRFPDYSRCNQVDDLVRLFTRLDGKPEPDHRNGTYSITSAAMQRGEATLETEYLAFRWYGSARTLHLTFLRPDLVDQLNAILAKRYPGALPCPH